MAISFESLLTRADGPQLADLLPAGVVRLLNSIDPELAYPKNLVKILCNSRRASDLLKDTEARTVLLDLLPIDQANMLAKILSGVEHPDPFKYLALQTFSKKNQLEVLFEFFGVGIDEDDRDDIGSADVVVPAAYPLFDHQNIAKIRVTELLLSEPHRVLLHMPTGAGKTRTAMNIIADYLRSRRKAVVVWLAHSEELCSQAASEFEKAWALLGNRKLRVAKFWGPYDSDLTDLNDGIVIAGLAKAFARLKTDDKHFRAVSTRSPFVVIDEAHQAIAPTYKQLLDLLVRPTTGAQLLGLSATPGRSWNDPTADEALSDYFGRRKVTLQVEGYKNPVSYLIDQQFLAQPEFRRIRSNTKISLNSYEQHVIEETFDLPKSVLDRLGTDEARNLLIVAEIERISRRHQRILVFASSVDQSDLLAAVLRARGYWAASVSSKSTKQARASAIDGYLDETKELRILINYGVLTTGFDAPRTSAAVIARPTFSLVLYSQMIGRAMRGPKAGGNPTAEIVTVVDTALPGFESVESAFSNWEDVWNQD